MKRIRALLVALPLLLLAAGPVHAAASISIDQPAPYSIGESVTFTTTVPKLTGGQYPLVYLACIVNGRTVYGQLDLPSATFPLGGGSSPWIDPADPDYLAPATCIGYLYAYPNPHKSDAPVLLAQTAPFAAA